MPTTEPTTETRYLVRQDSPAARAELDELSRLQAKAAGVSRSHCWCDGKQVEAAEYDRMYPGGLRHSRPEPDASGTRLRIDVLAPEAEQPWTEEAKSLTPQERGKLQAARAAQVKKPVDWHVPRADRALSDFAAEVFSMLDEPGVDEDTVRAVVGLAQADAEAAGKAGKGKAWRPAEAAEALADLTDKIESVLGDAATLAAIVDKAMDKVAEMEPELDAVVLPEKPAKGK